MKILIVLAALSSLVPAADILVCDQTDPAAVMAASKGVAIERAVGGWKMSFAADNEAHLLTPPADLSGYHNLVVSGNNPTVVAFDISLWLLPKNLKSGEQAPGFNVKLPANWNEIKIPL